MFQVPEMEAYTYIRSKLLPSFIESDEYQAFLGTKYPISGSKNVPRNSTMTDDVILDVKGSPSATGETETKTEEGGEGNTPDDSVSASAVAAQGSEVDSAIKPNLQQNCCSVQ